MDIRYSLLPYIYTLFHSAHTTGSTVMRALQWEFPNIPSLANADHQFLLGPSILVTPVLSQGATSVFGVFPGAAQGAKWYDWYNQSTITNTGAMMGMNVSIPAPLGHIPVFIRGGSILPMQPPKGALTTRDARTKPWSLLVALDGAGAANGSLYVDDGESVHPNATLEVTMEAKDGSVGVDTSGKYQDMNALDAVTVMGVTSMVNNVQLNAMDINNGNASFSYDGSSQLLKVTGLEGLTSTGAWSKNWRLSWH